MRIQRFTLISALLVLAGAGCDSPIPGASDAAITPDVEPDAGLPTAWGGLESVTMTVEDGLPIIEGTVDGEGPYSFVLDTLSQVIFVDDDIVGTELYTEATLTIGGEDLGLQSVKGRELDPDSMFVGRMVGGLLGQGYFNERFTLLDYARRRAYLHHDTPDLALPPPGYAGLPRWEVEFELPNLMAVATPVIGAAGEVRLLADTSSRISIVFQRVFDAIDDGSLPQLPGYRFTTKYGEEDGFVTRLPEVSFDPMVALDVVAVVLPDDNHLKNLLTTQGVNIEGFLGAQFWGRFAVGVDGHPGDDDFTRRFILWGTGASHEDTDALWTKVGVELSALEGIVRVEMVYQGTSAATAGLVVGDVLVGESDLDAARAKLHGAAGETRSLAIRHADDSEETIDVQVEALLQ